MKRSIQQINRFLGQFVAKAVKHAKIEKWYLEFDKEE